MKKTTCNITFCSPAAKPESLLAYLKKHKATEKDGVHTFNGPSQKVRCDLSLERHKTDHLAIFLTFTDAYGMLQLYTFPDSLANGRSHHRGTMNEALSEAAILRNNFEARYEASKKSQAKK